MLTITLLGTAATMPLPDRALSTAFAACGGHGLLFDCGEGTQAAARRAGVNLMRADAVCLTHYHGDHIFGLPGLLQTLGAQGRTRPLLLVYNILSIGMDRSKIFRHPRGRDRSPAEARCVFVLKSIGDQHLRAVSILPRPPVWRSAFFRRGGHYHPTDGEAQEITETMKAADQMTWSGKMNNIRAGAMEVVDKEIIYT